MNNALVPEHKSGYQRLTLYSAVFYFFSVAVLCFTPMSFTGHTIQPLMAGWGTVNFVIFQSIDATFYLNIVMAIPLGIYYGLLIPRANIFKVFVVGLLASSLVETVQYVLNHSLMLNRSMDIDDVIANVLGVLIGYIVLWVIRLVLPSVVKKFQYFIE
ncbi:hypothetical protein FC84_GL001179 [Lapidilactobacillus dextrinicus DSM 20335]|uniref:VanZ-like domain-containing protein n=1 Tax=Lapidilactobacillus dextrinicus DSM 20335 TaxID=1423738 RepID=A0A0R2BKN2_9LACO|nr:VanZ family protein [Lapidilactobacillus dextrinicus]KRM78356.1 hypothetical protein FC84_GL001179 [Lapidilactobacillus dextrinicus DSM 20335]QFG47348.1 VanZ family protein [Lapidilactobacillus dextrinicus]